MRSSTLAGRVPPAPSGSSIGGELLGPAFAQHVGRRCRLQACVPVWRGRRSRPPSAMLHPRDSIAASMSTRRLENARSTVFGMSRSSLRPLRRMSQARPSGASSARSADR